MRSNVAVALASCVGALLVARVTHDGMGTTNDSFAYAAAAGSVLRSEGLTVPWAPCGAPETNWPYVHHAPLYPLVLAAASTLSGTAPLHAAMGLAFVLAWANAALVGLIVLARTDSRGLAVLGSILVSTSESFIYVHASVFSEPLFLLLVVAEAHVLARAITTGSAGAFGLAGTFAGLALLDRYAAIPFVGVGLVFAAICGRKQTTAFALPVLALATPWLLRNALLVGAPTDRSLGWHPCELAAQLAPGAREVGNWAFPDLLGRSGRLVLATGLLVVFVRARSARPIYVVAASMIVAYVAFLVASITCFDRAIPLDERILSPVPPLLVIALLDALGQVRLGKRALVVALAFVALRAYCAEGVVLNFDRAERRCYGGPTFTRSEILPRLAEVGTDLPIYSNAYVLVASRTGRRTHPLPARSSIREWLSFVSALNERGGLLVELTTEQLPLMPVNEIRARMPGMPGRVREVLRGWDGVVCEVGRHRIATER